MLYVTYIIMLLKEYGGAVHSKIPDINFTCKMALKDKWSDKLIASYTTPHVHRKTMLEVTSHCSVRNHINDS